jgi:hypothetical protein
VCILYDCAQRRNFEASMKSGRSRKQVIRLQEADTKTAACHSPSVEAIYAKYCRGGGMGRRTGLKIRAKGVRQTQTGSRILFFIQCFRDFNVLD